MSMYRGRGRGRHGRGGTSKKWVRPDAAQQQGDDEGKSTHRQPLLKGPPQQQKLAARVWKRPRTKSDASKTEANVSLDKMVNEEKKQETQKEQKPATMGKDPPLGDTELKRTGRNKLVRTDNIKKKESPRLAPIVKKAPPPVLLGHNKIVLKKKETKAVVQEMSSKQEKGESEVVKEDRDRMKEDDGSEKEGTSAAATRMKKRGRNKLVKQSQQQQQQDGSKPPEVSQEPSTDTITNETLRLRKRGQHKLVLQDGKAAAREAEALAARKRQHAESIRGRRRRGGPVIKRVKLNAAGDDEGHVETDEVVGESEKDGKPEAAPPPPGEKLTDFAYRETKVARRGRQGRDHMGLVRFQPTAAPICGTFMRGIPCTNPKCTKRHDIPKEAATPICSFFQHNGMCLKRETCPFRHVKVNPQATVCPCFALLGFCEDKECLMKHVRPNRRTSSAQSKKK